MSAVKTVEDVKEEIRLMKQAYQTVLGDASPAVMTVLKDLREFCRADETCFHPDARIHAVLEGRREVFLKISNYLTKTTDDIVEMRLKRLQRNENRE